MNLSKKIQHRCSVMSRITRNLLLAVAMCCVAPGLVNAGDDATATVKVWVDISVYGKVYGHVYNHDVGEHSVVTVEYDTRPWRGNSTAILIFVVIDDDYDTEYVKRYMRGYRYSIPFDDITNAALEVSYETRFTPGD